MLENYTELIAVLILFIVLTVFTFGKSPVFRVDRAGAAIIGATLMMSFGIISFEQATYAIDYRTITVLFSMMVIVANLKIAGFFDLVGQIVLRNISTKAGLLIAVIAISGFLSAIAINDVVCLLFTSVVIFICRQVNCNPIPHLLGLAMASNIGSASTFLGNPQNILIGNLSHMSFYSYFLTTFPISIVGLILLFFMLKKAYSRDLQGLIENSFSLDIHFHPYLIIKTISTLVAIIIFYLIGYDIALVSSLGAAFLLITRRINPNKIYTSIDFNLLVIFIGLFVIVGGIDSSGLLNKMNTFIPPEYTYDLTFFALINIILSNIVSNVPAVLLLQYYVPPHSIIHWQALALFSTIAGNLTLFGSIANLIVVEIAKKQQVIITAKEYFIIGFPLTIILSIFSLIWLTIR